jgi:hypothetical protein
VERLLPCGFFQDVIFQTRHILQRGKKAMSDLGAIFQSTADSQTDFRKLCTTAMGRDGTSPYAGIYAALLDTGFDGKTDALPFASILWNKKTDRFAIAFPHKADHALHRLKAHFFLEGYPGVKDSGAFKSLETVLEALPALKGKEYAVSPRTDRIIDNLTHAQLKAVVTGITDLNRGLSAIAQARQQLQDSLKRTVDDAFGNKAVQPVAAPEQKPAARAVPTAAKTAGKKGARKNPRPE